MITPDMATITDHPADMSIERAIASAAPAGVAAATLFAWFSPAFPTGGFGYSHGLEAAVAEGRVKYEADLGGWIGAVLSRGAGWTDAVLLALAHTATANGAVDEQLRLIDLASALAPSKERLAESLDQGEAFLTAVRAGWPDAVAKDTPGRLGYAVAAGIAAAGLGCDQRPATSAYLTGFCANLAAAGLRLGLCGQTGSVRIIAALGPVIAAIAERAAHAEESDLGGCALGVDIASMRHETLNGRLFLS